MKIKKIFAPSDTALGKIEVKNSAGFVEDLSYGETLRPALVTVSDADSWRFYKGNDWIFSTVNRIVHDCVKVKPKIVPKDKTRKVKGRIAARIKEVSNFLENPNSNKEHFFELREKSIRDMLVYGRSTMEKVLSSSTRKLVELYAQTPKYITIAADGHGNVPTKRAYKLEPPGRSNESIQWYDIDEMIFMTLLPVSTSVYGLKIMDSIANSVAADILRSVYNAKFFVNGAEAAGIIGLEGMSKTELNRFRSYWKENFKGANKAHKTAAVNVPVKYVRMALTNRDLQFKEYGVELRTKIFSAYNMQPFIMGIIDATTGKLNSVQQVESYKDGAIRPILTREEHYYTEEIIKMGFGYTDIVMEFPDIDLADIEKQSTIDSNDLKSGVIVINEIRRRRGLAEVPWGNTPLSMAPGGGQVDPTTGTVIPPSIQENGGAPKPKPKPKKSLFDKCVCGIQLCVDAIIENGEKELKEIPTINIQEFFKEKQIFANGKSFKIKDYHLPHELRKTKLWEILEKGMNDCISLENDDVRSIYLRSVTSKIKYLFFNAIIVKNLNNLRLEIDRYVYEEKKTDFYCEIF